MNFIEAAGLARADGCAIRCKGWIEGIMIRWSWHHLKWQGTGNALNQPEITWVDVPNHPNPNDIQRDDWEVINLVL